jgi:hypothetical protein
MDKKSLTVVVLSLTAAALFVANLLVPARTAVADEVIKDRDYQVITARWQANDEALLIVDNRTGQMAAFVYDPNVRGVMLKAVRPVMDAFAK